MGEHSTLNLLLNTKQVVRIVTAGHGSARSEAGIVGSNSTQGMDV
jgi:hypothetical protein